MRRKLIGTMFAILSLTLGIARCARLEVGRMVAAPLASTGGCGKRYHVLITVVC